MYRMNRAHRLYINNKSDDKKLKSCTIKNSDFERHKEAGQVTNDRSEAGSREARET